MALRFGNFGGNASRVRVPECSWHKGLEEKGRECQSASEEATVGDQSSTTLGLRTK